MYHQLRHQILQNKLQSLTLLLFPFRFISINLPAWYDESRKAPQTFVDMFIHIMARMLHDFINTDCKIMVNACGNRFTL
jgi:hypothetical protein